VLCLRHSWVSDSYIRAVDIDPSTLDHITFVNHFHGGYFLAASAQRPTLNVNGVDLELALGYWLV
jgi:hypothetical protein